MDKDEEYRLIGLSQAGDQGARDTLVQEYQYFAHSEARKLFQTNDRYIVMELRSAAVLGLLDAIDRFDCSLGFRLTTYAHWRVKNRVLESLADLYKDANNAPITPFEESLPDEQEVDSTAHQEHLADLRYKILSCSTFNPQERAYAQMRWIDGLRQNEIADKMGVAAQRANQLDKQVLSKLKRKFSKTT